MNVSTALVNALTLGTMTGLRSTTGMATLAQERRSGWAAAAMTAAVGEFIADKSPFAGDRIAPVPLIGRAVLGGIAGALVSDTRDRAAIGAVAVGAAAAVAAAYAGHRFRTRTRIGNVVGGLIEDAVVLSLSALYLRQPRRG